MTYEEALEAMRFYKEKLCNGIYNQNIGAFDVAMEAIEKQIAKKPSLEGDGYDENGELIYDTWICPYCEEHYEVDYDHYRHCPNCGQALDWSNEI